MGDGWFTESGVWKILWKGKDMVGQNKAQETIRTGKQWNGSGYVANYFILMLSHMN